MPAIKHSISCLMAMVALLGATPAPAASHTLWGPQGAAVAPSIELAQRGECSRRMGPYATQRRAWELWRQARAQGYPVSRGVFPCYDGYGTRGHCFNVYYPC